jgi:hypothetical protein
MLRAQLLGRRKGSLSHVSVWDRVGEKRKGAKESLLHGNDREVSNVAFSGCGHKHMRCSDFYQVT